MGEPQGWDELPCDHEEIDDDHEESEGEYKARLQDEKCEDCRQQGEQFGEEVDCALCGITEAELDMGIPVPMEAPRELSGASPDEPF